MGKGSEKKERRQSRKQRMKELEEARKKRNMILVMLVTVVAIAMLGFVMLNSNNSDSQLPYIPVNVNNQSNVVNTPVSGVTSTASYYSYNAQGVDIGYFMVVGSDGEIHTAFDACDVCHDSKKGYEQQDNEMVCRNCGNRYSTNQIGTANQGGGCWPGYLKHTIENGEVIIETSELEAGRWYFV